MSCPQHGIHAHLQRRIVGPTGRSLERRSRAVGAPLYQFTGTRLPAPKTRRCVTRRSLTQSCAETEDIRLSTGVCFVWGQNNYKKKYNIVVWMVSEDTENSKAQKWVICIFVGTLQRGSIRGVLTTPLAGDHGRFSSQSQTATQRGHAFYVL